MVDSVTVPREKLEKLFKTADGVRTANWREWGELATSEHFERWAKARAGVIANGLQALLNSSSEPQAQAGEKTVMEIPISYGHLDANALEQVAKEHPNKYFLKGSGVLKLITAIRELEQKLAAAEARERHTKETLNKLLAAPPQ
jgi:hypothetical protein